MGWVQVLLAVPAAALLVTLIHDFLAGLAEERQWSDPMVEDPYSLAFRSARSAELALGRFAEVYSFPTQEISVSPFPKHRGA